VFAEFHLVLKDALQAFGDLAYIVYVKSDDVRSNVGGWVHEDCVIGLCMCVAHFVKGAAHLDILNSATLLSVVDTFLEFEDMALRDIKTGRGLHIDFFLKISVEVRGLNVYLVNFKIAFGSEGENGAE
jgi:hypothetical protein